MSKKKIITQKQIENEVKRIKEKYEKKIDAIISEAQKARNKKIDFIKNMIQEIFLPKVEELQKDLFKLNKRNLQKTLKSINLTFADTEEKEKNTELIAQIEQLKQENAKLKKQIAQLEQKSNNVPPSKEGIVKDWQATHPNGTKKQCHIDTGLAFSTVCKWWK